MRQWIEDGVFGFRFQLPHDVIAALATVGRTDVKSTVTCSLKSRDPLVARSRALQAAADIGELIAAVRSRAGLDWTFDPTLYQRDRVVSPSLPQEPDAPKRWGGREGAREMRTMTLRRAYEEIYIPRRQERKGAPPRRRSRLDIEKAIKRFIASAGDKALPTITRQDAEAFVRGLDVRSVATAEKMVTSLSVICNAAVAADLISTNPFRGLGPDRTAIVAARRSYARFDLDQLERFFARTECEDGAVLWLPRLLLLTGAPGGDGAASPVLLRAARRHRGD